MTRQRLYLETMESVLGDVQMFVMDSQSDGGQGDRSICRSTNFVAQLRENSDAQVSTSAAPFRSDRLHVHQLHLRGGRARKGDGSSVRSGPGGQGRPGLAFKIPFIQNVVFYDARIQGLETNQLEVTRSTIGG